MLNVLWSAILPGYSESCMRAIKDIISQKGVATGRGVETEWTYMYKRQCFDPFS